MMQDEMIYEVTEVCYKDEFTLVNKSTLYYYLSDAKKAAFELAEKYADGKNILIETRDDEPCMILYVSKIVPFNIGTWYVSVSLKEVK